MTQNSIHSTKETNIDGVLVGFVIFLLLFTGVVLYKYNKTAVDIKVKRIVNRNAHVVILSTYGPTVHGSPFYEKYVDKAVKFILDPKNKVDELLIVGGYTVDPNISQSQAVLNYIKEKYPEFNSSNIPVTLDECGITTWMNIRNSKKLMDQNSISAKEITIFAEDSRKQKVAFFANHVFPIGNSIDGSKDEIQREVNMYVKLPKEEQLQDFNNPKQLKDYQSHSVEELKERESDESRNSDAWPMYTHAINQENSKYNIEIITVPSGLAQEYIDDEHIKIFQEIKEFYDESYGRQKVKERLDDWSKIAGFNTIDNLVNKGCVEYKEFFNK